MIFEIYRRLYEIALKATSLLKERYSYHWQKGDLVFRHDNARKVEIRKDFSKTLSQR